MAEFTCVVVTGGAGFIGSNYVRYALEHHPGWQVVVLDKLTYAGNLENLREVRDRIEFVQGDIADAEDHAAGIDVVLHRGLAGEAYNLGAREQITGIGIASRVLQLLEKPADLIQFVTDRPGHDYRYSVDPGKAERLGWQRKWSFGAGLADTVDWYLRNEPWWAAVRGGQDFERLQQDWYLSRQA